MRRPATATMVLGHPAIAGPMMLAGGIGLLAAFQSSNALIAILSVAMLASVHKANEQASAYRAWKAAWDAMAETPPPRTNTLSRFIGGVLVLGVILLGVGSPSTVRWLGGVAAGVIRASGYGPVLAGFAALLLLILLVQFIRGYPRRPPSAPTVSITATPILPVPTLDAAYATLPEHCRQVLRR